MKTELPTTSLTDSKLRSLPWLQMAMLLLCLSVFAWGLRYKLSLYQNAAQTHPTTVAKLMQGEQKHWTAALHSEWTRSESPQFPASWMVTPFRSLIPPRERRQLGELAVPPLLARPMHVLFFRPPPQSL